MTLRFLSGLTEFSPILRAHMRKMLDSNIDTHSFLHLKYFYSKDYENILTLFHWLFERGDLADTARILGKRKIIVRSYTSWSALDYFVTGHCIARSNCSWDIDYRYSHMGDEKMSQFLRALSSADGEQENISLNLIDWSNNELTSQSLCHLQATSSFFLHSVKSFDVSRSNFDQAAVELIAKILPDLTQLEQLMLNSNPDIQKGGAVSIVSALRNHKVKKTVNS